MFWSMARVRPCRARLRRESSWRETRMTFQDFMVYRFADITYQRGVIFDRRAGPLKLSIGEVNGNGTEVNFNLNSPGYLRPDAMFDNDNRKDLFGRIGFDGVPDMGEVAEGFRWGLPKIPCCTSVIMQVTPLFERKLRSSCT